MLMLPLLLFLTILPPHALLLPSAIHFVPQELLLPAVPLLHFHWFHRSCNPQSARFPFSWTWWPHYCCRSSRFLSAVAPVDPYDQATLSCVNPRPVCLCAELPVHFKGIGLPWIADICYAAFVGAVEMTVPRFGDETLADGTMARRLANQLAPFVGDAKSFSGPSNRYLRFIGSGLILGKAFLNR